MAWSCQKQLHRWSLSHLLVFKSWAFYIALDVGLTCNRQNKEMQEELPFEARLQTTLVSSLQSFYVSF